ncbi:hypothetical protein L5515_004228 [Caenorhabditis briggsae]|uniref:Uncharacterized protein n=1 Tax=Caenorhabditis briggsae TaxID=6238 RepID=A0AAE9EKT7_CAEBR|nr:hypothetical protein L3Y34_001371 [Caenorhabditis briggsae]UMM23568.1 hypothetical protein L5515_004228 [Caenorhabditis briggsae]
MSAFQDLKTSTWAFFEAYGWATVIATIIVYFIYKKYFYDLLRDRNEKKKQSKQEAFNREVHDKESDRIRLVRKRQQEEHNKQEKIETMKRLEKEKEKSERMQKELNKRDQASGVYYSGVEFEQFLEKNMN